MIQLFEEKIYFIDCFQPFQKNAEFYKKKTLELSKEVLNLEKVLKLKRFFFGIHLKAEY